MDGPRPETVLDQARRTDPSGIEDVAEFIGPERSRILVHATLPPSAKRAVLICSSVHAEQVAGYRKEWLLARRLAAEGSAVVRFSYRGAGNSEGATEELSLDTMIEDAEAAATRLAELAGVEVTVVLGTRLGALVATETARTRRAPGLALWEPVRGGSQFLKEAFRARTLRLVREGKDPSSDNDPRDEIRTKGWADVLGYPISARLYDSLQSAALGWEGIPASCDVFLAQIAGSETLRKPLARLAEEMKASGRRLTTVTVQDDESWWFPRQPFRPDEVNPATAELLENTTSWILSLR